MKQTIMLNKNFRVLVTGSNGQLGSELKSLSKMYNYKFFFSTKENLDITNVKALKQFVLDNQVNTIINCAAYTAVDRAEDNDQLELADAINHLAVGNMAQLSKELNITLVHISTDYVFNGESFKPYSEHDSTQPKTVYGQTKLNGEKALIKVNPGNSIIIRTSWVYSSYGSSFVKTMLRLGKEKDSLGVIYDQVGTPTYAQDLARVILDILPKLSNDKVEIYHYSNEGVLSWYDFAKVIMDTASLDCKVNPIETFEYPTPAKRPHYSVLSKRKIKSTFNIDIPYWKDSLNDCLALLGDKSE